MFFYGILKSKLAYSLKEEFENSGTCKTNFSISKEDSLSEALTKFLTEEEQAVSVIDIDVLGQRYLGGGGGLGGRFLDYFKGNEILENSLLVTKFGTVEDVAFLVGCIREETLEINLKENSLIVVGFMLGWCVELITSFVHWNRTNVGQKPRQAIHINQFSNFTKFLEKFITMPDSAYQIS